MLSNEKCIAVAEKVWGWRINGNGIILKPCGTISVTAITVDELRKDVNSWSGFGRTVGAMAERFLYLSLHPTECEFVEALTVSFVRSDSTTASTMCYNPKNSESVIEATHLAALEAVRQEKG